MDRRLQIGKTPWIDRILGSFGPSSDTMLLGRSTVIRLSLTTGVIALLAGFGLHRQLSTHINHDIAWILYSSAQLIDGARFGVDVLAANPPLAWYLSMPAVMVADWFDWPFDIAFRLEVTVLALSALVSFWLIMPDRRGLGATIAVLILAYYLFIGCYRDFGQREYLCVVLAMPYLALTARRIAGTGIYPWVAVAVGIAAGLGFALKPHFVAAFAAIECILILHRPTWRHPQRPEFLAIVGTGFLYALSVALFAPHYLTDVLPLVQDTYWGFENSETRLFKTLSFSSVALALALGFYAVSDRSPLLSVVIAAVCGFTVSYLIQYKGYSYHEFPVRAFVATALAMEAVGFLSNGKAGLMRYAFAALLSMTIVVVIVTNIMTVQNWYRAAVRPTGVIAQQIDELVEIVNRHAKGESFIAISTHPFPGFPIAVYADARWGSRSNSVFLIPAIVKMRNDPTIEPDRLANIESIAHRFLREDIAASQPALILVDVRPVRHAIGRRDFDLLAFYREDPTLRLVLDSYETAGTFNGFLVLIRSSSAE